MGIFSGILIASDLDGTLLKAGVASPENIKAIEYFIENGGLFTVATGRDPEFIKSLNLPVNAPVIAINGCMIYDGDNEKILKTYTFSHEKLDTVKEISNSGEGILRTTLYMPEGMNFIPPITTEFEKYTKPISKVVFVCESIEATDKLKKICEKKYSSGFSFERSWGQGLEMRSSAGGKGECLKFIKQYTGAKTAIAVGDFENDITMIDAADIGYAPCSGHPDVLAAADRITVACENHVIAAIVNELMEKGLK